MDKTIGQQVIISKDPEWGNAVATSAAPNIGLVGIVADPNVYPYPEPPEGKTAVIFQARDLGYIPSDEDEETVCLYILTRCLESF
jgi:hypothetical protein